MTDLSKIRTLYDNSIGEYGIDPRSVGWTKAGSQELRFKKLMEVVDNKNETITLNELGCGYGELYKYCLQEGFHVARYSGYDISDKMLKAARHHLGNSKKVELLNQPVLTSKADYSVTSGIFNVKFDHSDAEWKNYILKTLRNLYEYSEKGFSFNLLTKYVDYEEEHLFYADPGEFFHYCKENFSRKVSLFHDYDLFEWTMLIRKDSR